MIDVREILKDFMLTPAPSGYEKLMSYKMKEYFDKMCDEAWIDNVGNSIGKISGTDPSAPRTLIFGHMDSLGLVVRQVRADGSIGINRLGGTTEKVLLGNNYTILTDNDEWYPAVIGPMSHHVTPAQDKFVIPQVEEMSLEVGASTAEEVYSLGIHEGSPIVFEPRCKELLDGKLSGTAVDNRGACACLVRMAELLSEKRPIGDVYLMGSVWEEFNLRGAVVAAHVIKPDVAISLDISLAGDAHDMRDIYNLCVGKGPAVALYSFHGRGTLNGIIAHQPLYRLSMDCAKKLGINLQRTMYQGMLMDSSYIAFEEAGVATIDMGFPARYTHTPVELCDPSDIEQLAVVCSEVARKIDGDFQLKRF